MSTRADSRLRQFFGATAQLRITWIDRGTEDLSLGFATRIRTFNRATLVMLLLLVPYLGACILLGERAAVALLLPAFMWLLALPLLLRRHYFALARALTVAVVNATIFVLASRYGRGLGVHLLFFAAAAFPLGIYESRERSAIFVGVSVAIVAGTTFTFSGPSFAPTAADRWHYALMMLTTFIMTLHPMWAFGREMLGYQELLLMVNQTINAETARREKLELQLENTRRVEALGELAAGVAHEINTPLQYVTDSVSFLDRSGQRLLSFAAAVERIMPELEPGHRTQLEQLAKRIKLSRLREEHLKAWMSAEEGLSRVSELVVAMKALANPSGKRVIADVNEILNNAALVTRGKWGGIAELKLELDSELPHAEVVAGELGQVFVHLIANAADAIRDKSGSGQGSIVVRSLTRAGRIEIEVQDTGCGIPDSIKDRVFEPFFTTKEVGRGSGQGLSLAYTTVLHHDGQLTFDSTPGVGTVFRLYLPLAAKSAERESVGSNARVDESGSGAALGGGSSS